MTAACSGHGECILGACQCYRGWTGERCEQQAVTPSTSSSEGTGTSAGTVILGTSTYIRTIIDVLQWC
jgi:hypothetical protein